MKTWIFDVDGVITNLKLMSIDKKEILDEIYKRLNYEPVALITGRSLSWVKKSALEKLSLNRTQSNNLFIAAEFGLVIATYKNGAIIEEIENSLKVPQSIIEAAGKAIRKYSTLFQIEEKQTIFTAKNREGALQHEIKEVRKHATAELRTLLEQGNYENLEVQSDTSAVSIRNKKANKRHATERLLDWLRIKGISPDAFIVFGDSESDFEMGDRLYDVGKKILFVYVGEGNPGERSFKVIKTEKHYDEGTLEYLEKNS